jgi:hypothetical protein
MRECKKCHVKKELEQFNDMINLGKSYDCKECRALYNKTYQATNKIRIRENERIRRLKQKELNARYDKVGMI